MADATIDELLAAIEEVRRLKDTLKRYDLVLGSVTDRLADAERRLTALEASPTRKRRV